MKKPTLTVGIPAYNEDANIAYLLKSLLRQKRNKFVLEKIIVASDASTDGTVSIVKNLRNKKILLIDNPHREGQGVRQNQIIKMVDSDILILLNADIIPVDLNLLDKMVNAVFNYNADMVSVKRIAIRPETFIERIIFASVLIKRSVFENYNNGLNVFTCTGVARAFSKRLYRRLKFKNSVGEDAYSYFYCIKNGYKYHFEKDTGVYYRLPANYKDHKKQSIRYFQSIKAMKKIFGSEWISTKYRVPLSLTIRQSAKIFLTMPAETIAYVFVVIFTKLGENIAPRPKVTWDISASSKVLSRKL